MSNSLIICPDANLVVRLLLADESGSSIASLWKEWHIAGYSLIAPTLLFYEVSNVLHQHARQGRLSADEVRSGLRLAFRLNIKTIGDVFLHQRAVEIAQQWQLPATYDAHYLAVAERYKAQFFTTDARLISAIQTDLIWAQLWTE
jgi:predicted nucleic acid-binding protein